LVKSVLQVVHRVLTRFLFASGGLKPNDADNGAGMLIHCVGSAARMKTRL
jgi:hypothetical protein